MISNELAAAIRTAIRAGDVEKVRSLLGNDMEKVRLDTPFGTWLHIAAYQGQLESVKLLVSLGADLNAKGGTLGGAAINSAASKGHEAGIT